MLNPNRADFGVYREELADEWPENPWLQQVAIRAAERFENHAHGDRDRWLEALKCLPSVKARFTERRGQPVLGGEFDDPDVMRQALMAFHPWRKGPLRVGGVQIDTEWRSDWKWDRLAPHIGFKGRRVLDIGCGNGYFGYRMLTAGARLVVGVDPTLLFVMQSLVFRHYAGKQPNYVLPLGVEDLPDGPCGFDLVCSMGVLYHRKDPHEHLQTLCRLLPPGGTLLLETLVLPEDRATEILLPPGRYAAMRNVWAVPGCRRLMEWVGQAGFVDAGLLDVSPTTIEEQRSTGWMTFESLPQALDPDHPALTREGHPAPRRALIRAQKPL